MLKPTFSRSELQVNWTCTNGRHDLSSISSCGLRATPPDMRPHSLEIQPLLSKWSMYPTCMCVPVRHSWLAPFFRRRLEIEGVESFPRTYYPPIPSKRLLSCSLAGCADTVATCLSNQEVMPHAANKAPSTYWIALALSILTPCSICSTSRAWKITSCIVILPPKNAG